MKYVLAILLTMLINDPVKISRINSAKAEAKKAFQAGDYKTAAEKYTYLVDSLGVKEDEVLLNLAHAYYLMKDTANAANKYQPLAQSVTKEVSSKANQQLGLISNRQGKAEEALNYFKQAVKADPTNNDARYNYEMLKKKLDEQKKQEQQNKDQKKDEQKKEQNKEENKKEEEKKDPQNKEDEKKENKDNKDQQKKDQQQKEQEEKEQKEKEQKEQQEKEQQEKDQKDQQKKDQNLDKQKLEQMKISEEKARMILEAMKNQEKQYLQQNKRKATKSKDRTKPDW
jgi:Ca-activated chloride channel homolog